MNGYEWTAEVHHHPENDDAVVRILLNGEVRVDCYCLTKDHVDPAAAAQALADAINRPDPAPPWYLGDRFGFIQQIANRPDPRPADGPLRVLRDVFPDSITPHRMRLALPRRVPSVALTTAEADAIERQLSHVCAESRFPSHPANEDLRAVVSGELNLTIGVDPGKTGAIAILDGRRILDICDMPDLTGAALGSWLRDLLDDLAPHTVAVAWVEKVGAMPRQGVSSTWTFAEGYGALLGALGACGVPVRHVTPAKWKKAAGLSRDKAASRQRACELWPDEAHRFARVKDDGRAEAALVALHGVEEA